MAAIYKHHHFDIQRQSTRLDLSIHGRILFDTADDQDFMQIRITLWTCNDHTKPLLLYQGTS